MGGLLSSKRKYQVIVYQRNNSKYLVTLLFYFT